MSEIDHLIKSGAKKISRNHPKSLRRISEELHQITQLFGRFHNHSIAHKASIRAGFRNIAGATIERSKYKKQKKAEACLYDHPQQPTNVVPGRTQHRVNPITGFTLQVASIHSMIMLQMPDDRFDRLAAFVQSQFGFVQSPLLSCGYYITTEALAKFKFRRAFSVRFRPDEGGAGGHFWHDAVTTPTP